MNKKTVFFLAAPALLAFGSCAILGRRQPAPTARPDWIENWSAQYPSDEYLAGVGVGYTQASAEDFARGEIAKIFSAQVSVQESASQAETDADGGAGGGSSTLESSASEGVKTVSHKVLTDAVIAADWEDQESNQYYALAILDRQKAQASISDEINGLDAQTQQLQSAMGQAKTKLAKAKSAMGIVADLDKRRELSAELRVVGESGTSIPSPIDDSTARAQAQKALAALDVVIQLSGDDSNTVSSGLIQGLDKLGIEARAGDATQKGLDIAITGSVFTAQQNLGDGSPWQRAQSDARILVEDASNSKDIASIRPSERADAQDYQTAVGRSLDSLSKACAKQIQKAVSDYLAGQ